METKQRAGTIHWTMTPSTGESQIQVQAETAEERDELLQLLERSMPAIEMVEGSVKHSYEILKLEVNPEVSALPVIEMLESELGKHIEAKEVLPCLPTTPTA
jgi:hypothetical protein